jgi:hypothetical protein
VLGPLEKAGLAGLEFWTMEKVQKLSILSVMHHRQNPSDSSAFLNYKLSLGESAERSHQPCFHRPTCTTIAPNVTRNYIQAVGAVYNPLSFHLLAQSRP